MTSTAQDGARSANRQHAYIDDTNRYSAAFALCLLFGAAAAPNGKSSAGVADLLSGAQSRCLATATMCALRLDSGVSRQHRSTRMHSSTLIRQQTARAACYEDASSEAAGAPCLSKLPPHFRSRSAQKQLCCVPARRLALWEINLGHGLIWAVTGASRSVLMPVRDSRNLAETPCDTAGTSRNGRGSPGGATSQPASRPS